MLDAPADETYGYELVQATGLPSGSVYPILRRLEDRGFVTAREEVIDTEARRPRHRVYYRLTAEGRRVAHEATREHTSALRSLNPGWQALAATDGDVELLRSFRTGQRLRFA
jgi:PadR family transcriptional regulator PadR